MALLLDVDLTDVGCSMAAVTLFTVVVKEGGIAKLTEVLLIVVIGGNSGVLCARPR